MLLYAAVVLAGSWTSAAQNHYDDRIRLAVPSRVCEPSKDVTCGADMHAVSAALRSPEALWRFITSPDTGYFERIAAASRAGKLIPAAWIPKLLSAQKELATEEQIHKFGVQRYPFDQAGPYFQRTPRELLGSHIRRTILGHSFTVPDKWIDYPLTGAELKQSPWAFQVSQALRILYWAMATDGDPAQIDAVALKLPCDSLESARVLVNLTSAVAAKQQFISDDVYGAWLNVIRNPKIEPAAFGNIGSPDPASHTFGPKSAVLALEAVRGQSDELVRELAFFGIGRYSLILASSRFVLSSDFRKFHTAQDQANDAIWLRYAYAVGGNNPGRPESPTRPFPEHLVGDAAAYQKVVDDFAGWFKRLEPFLERSAALEQPAIEKAYREMEIVTVCRSRP
jgi:hypothetical protein